MTGLSDEEVRLPSGGPRLAVRHAPGPGRPVLLVHGLASNSRLWDGVAVRLAAAGHEVVAVDLRGHGRSDRTTDGHTTEQAAADLAALVEVLDLTGARAPVAAGQSWGGNVVVGLAARHGAAAAVALVDGGWIVLGDRFATFDECWSVLAPPVLDGVRPEELERRFRAWHPDWPDEGIAGSLANFEVTEVGTARPRLAREHHRSILHSMWATDVRELMPRVRVPALLAAAVPAGADEVHRADPLAAAALLPDAEIRWYEGADHDLHAQHPDRLAADLLDLSRRADEAAS
jgi:pimeloyl-ACP methyl ester carboxylesterase